MLYDERMFKSTQNLDLWKRVKRR